MNFPSDFASLDGPPPDFSDIYENLDSIEIYISGGAEIFRAEWRDPLLRRISGLTQQLEQHRLNYLASLSALLPQAVSNSSAPPPINEAGFVLALEIVEFIRRVLGSMELKLHCQALPETLLEFLEEVAEAIRQRLKSLATAGTAETPFSPLPMRILVADDEDMVRMFFKDTLTECGYLVMEAAEGRAAIRAVETRLFGLVFTDINMPAVDGIRVLKRAKEISTDVEVVIITGYASVENAAEAIRAGAYDYLTKPFHSAADIFNVVRRSEEHLALRRRNRLLMLNLQRRNNELSRYANSLEDALRTVEEKQRALVHADRMATLGVLSAGVAHEINNPTTFIRGNLQTLQKFWNTIFPILAERSTPEDNRLRFIVEETPSLIQDMIVGTERISRIVSGLRSFSHQGERHDKDQICAAECVDSALALVQNRLKGRVEIDKNLPPDLPRVYANAQQIVQVLVNLFVNAADAMEHTSAPRLVITACPLPELKQIEIRITDNGQGIPEEVAYKIFDPFFTTKGVGKGTGLGLSILLGIVREHGGSITFHCSPERPGTTFYLRLPTDSAAAMPLPAAHKRVLVVDDEEHNRRMLQTAFHASGNYQAETANTGADALLRAKEHPPQAILLDLVLPDMDGFEVLSQLKANPKTSKIPVIAMTALDLNGVHERLKNLGASGVFFKPFRFRDVYAKLEEVCRT